MQEGEPGPVRQLDRLLGVWMAEPRSRPLILAFLAVMTVQSQLDPVRPLEPGVLADLPREAERLASA